MKYQKMKCNKILAELDSEEKARSWIWLAKFGHGSKSTVFSEHWA